MKKIQGLRVHFIGINGTSMSGLMMLSSKLGAITSGSDKVCGEYYKMLSSLKMDVYCGVNRQKALDSDLIVYSGAIPKNHPEIVEGRSMERGEFLGFLSSFFEKTLAVSGTHGKTTVTAMICHALKLSNYDFSYTFGGIDCETKTNFGYFGRKLLVLEACEYRNSFLSLNPTISLITSLEYDHPDFFKNFDELRESFSKFASNTKNTLILGKNVEQLLDSAYAHVQTFAFDKNFYISEYVKAGECILYDNGQKYRIKTNLLGEYNLYNACLAFRTLEFLGVKQREILSSLFSFKGVQRRQEFIGFFNGAKCFTDYAHHPTQIKALIDGFNGSVTVVFEPHTYSRTKSLFQEFSQCFQGCKEVIILPVYGAREKYDADGDSETLFESIINTNKYLAKSYEDAENYLQSSVNENDIILFTGAGTIDGWARAIVKQM